MNLLVRHEGRLWHLPVRRNLDETDFRAFQQKHGPFEAMLFPVDKKGKPVFVPINRLEYVTANEKET